MWTIGCGSAWGMSLREREKEGKGFLSSSFLLPSTPCLLPHWKSLRNWRRSCSTIKKVFFARKLAPQEEHRASGQFRSYVDIHRDQIRARMHQNLKASTNPDSRRSSVIQVCDLIVNKFLISKIRYFISYLSSDELDQ